MRRAHLSGDFWPVVVAVVVVHLVGQAGPDGLLLLLLHRYDTHLTRLANGTLITACWLNGTFTDTVTPQSVVTDATASSRPRNDRYYAKRIYLYNDVIVYNVISRPHLQRRFTTCCSGHLCVATVVAQPSE